MRMYGSFLSAYLKGLMEYRFSFFMDVFVNAFTHLVGFLNIWILLRNFNEIGGWSYYEIMLLYSVNLLPFGIAGLFVWAPMVGLEQMVRDGSFDSVLIKPMGPFRYLLCRGFQHTFLGHVIVAVVLFIMSVIKSHMISNMVEIFMLVIVLICSFIIHSCMMVIISSLSFWIIKTNTLFEIVIYNVRNFINYPLNIYNIIVRCFLTFIIPYAFVNFYPLEAIRGLKGDAVQSLKMMILTVGVTGIVLLLTITIWRKGITKYNSTGN